MTGKNARGERFALAGAILALSAHAAPVGAAVLPAETNWFQARSQQYFFAGGLSPGNVSKETLNEWSGFDRADPESGTHWNQLYTAGLDLDNPSTRVVTEEATTLPIRYSNALSGSTEARFSRAMLVSGGEISGSVEGEARIRRLDGDGNGGEDGSAASNFDVTFEFLEGYVPWTNPAGGTFATGSTWAGGSVPTSFSLAGTTSSLFHLDETYTVQFDADVSNEEVRVAGGEVGFDLDRIRCRSPATRACGSAAGRTRI